MSADIRVTTTLPTPHELGRRLNAATLKVMRDYAKKYVADWREKWRGWAYKDRPKSAPRLVSQREWRASASPTDTGAMLTITNQARDWRHKKDGYVAYVHRSGRPAEDVEWINVRDGQRSGIDLEFFDALRKSVLLGEGPKSRRVVGERGGGETITARGLEI